MDAGSDGPPYELSEMTLVCPEELLRRVGSVLDWCLRHGNMCDHPADFSAKVARIIDLGVEGDGSLPTAESLQRRGASVGSWWITEAAIDDCDLETYKCLARHAAEFRENIWGRPRHQLKRAKYVLEMVEAEMKIFRIRRCFAQMDMELVPVGAHNMEQFGGHSDEGADVGSNAEQERI